MEGMDNHKGKRQKLGRACHAFTGHPSPGSGRERDLLWLGSSEPPSGLLLVPWAWQKGQDVSRLWPHCEALLCLCLGRCLTWKVVG